MRFVLLVEGKTEDLAISQFIKRWLDPRLSQPVKVLTRRFEGSSQLIKDLNEQVRREFGSPGRESEVIAVLSLLGLYGLDLSFPKKSSALEERVAFAGGRLRRIAKRHKYHPFFAVHEVEAWLFSQPEIFEVESKSQLRFRGSPEDINDELPPAKRLREAYRNCLRRNYNKPRDGRNLFSKLDPNMAYDKCPHLKLMLDEMLRLAQEAGL
jgi:hypothetical protein